jgi:uncharacterized membrane protein
MPKNVRRHLPFLLAVVMGIAGFAVLSLLHWDAATVAAMCLFFLTYLILTAARFPHLTAEYLKTHAASADEPAPIILAITLGTIVVSLVRLFALINESGDTHDMIAFVLSLATVALGWFTIHTMAAIHYAHLYWRPDETTPEEDDRHEGLEFPGGTEPGVWEFLYFSFVTGMTAQTSDVGITTTGMRKFNMLHGIVSFFFNTVLVAVAVNVAVSMATPGQ